MVPNLHISVEKLTEIFFDLPICTCIEQSFYQTCFGHCAAQTQTLRSSVNSICAALSLTWVKNGEEIHNSWSCRRSSALLLYPHSQKSYKPRPGLFGCSAEVLRDVF